LTTPFTSKYYPSTPTLPCQLIDKTSLTIE
jgi:hypothetical protein